MKRPTTPGLHTVRPTSPPETPRQTSPSRPFSSLHVFGHTSAVRLPPRASGIKPTGLGHQFSYAPPDQLSPRSSSSSSDASDCDPDSASSIGPGAFSPECLVSSVNRSRDTHQIQLQHAGEVNDPVHVVAYSDVNFTVEELESEDSDTDDMPVVRPHAIEYPRSERSLSHDPDRLSRGRMMNNFAGLGLHENVIDDSDDDEYVDVDAHRRIIQSIREAKRRRRMTSGSVSKRTISESIGSDTDNEDTISFLGPEEAGCSARRLRRKYERHSFLFQDPPPPRIDELDEPPTTDDENDDDDIPEIFTTELPYWTTMEMD